MRLFVVGFPKSGTSTLHNALIQSGLVSVHWRHDASKPFVGESIYRNSMAGIDPFAGFSGVDAITQADVCIPDRNLNYWPQLDFSMLLSIRKYHPSCIFLLNWRCPEQIVASISRWSDLQHRLTISDIPGLPRGYGDKPEHLIQWIERHFSALRTVFRDDPNFIEVDIAHSEAPDRIGQALGTELVTWEYQNVSAERERKRAQHRRKKVHRALRNPKTFMGRVYRRTSAMQHIWPPPQK